MRAEGPARRTEPGTVPAGTPGRDPTAAPDSSATPGPGIARAWPAGGREYRPGEGDTPITLGGRPGQGCSEVPGPPQNPAAWCGQRGEGTRGAPGWVGGALAELGGRETARGPKAGWSEWQGRGHQDPLPGLDSLALPPHSIWGCLSLCPVTPHSSVTQGQRLPPQPLPCRLAARSIPGGAGPGHRAGNHAEPPPSCRHQPLLCPSLLPPAHATPKAPWHRYRLKCT